MSDEGATRAVARFIRETTLASVHGLVTPMNRLGSAAAMITISVCARALVTRLNLPPALKIRHPAARLSCGPTNPACNSIQVSSSMAA